MPSSLDQFEAIARSLALITAKVPAAQPHEEVVLSHAFESRNIHPGLPLKIRKLFDDGHFAEATFDAFKFLDKQVQKHSRLAESGFKLMMAAFDDANPRLQLTPLKTESDKDEQKGYRFIFAGGMQAIRNPRGHEYSVTDDPDTCLDHLSFVSMLLRRLEAAGFK
jgi:uncharacterized protein (TIGR02391 family)